MIRVLAFGPPRACGSRCVREARFVARSAIPLSALCVIANGVREHLRGLLGVALDVTLGEPVPLDETTRRALFERTHCYLTRGRTSDVFVFVGERDARRLLDAAFSERASESDLSPLERSALGRLVNELAALLDPLCAQRQSPASAVDASAASCCTTYVDLRIGPPVDATLGLGVTREPADERPSGPLVSAEQLLAVSCEVRAHVARGEMSAARLARLGPGEIVRMDTKVGAEAVLKVGELIVARGRGGAVTDESGTPRVTAFAVDSI